MCPSTVYIVASFLDTFNGLMPSSSRQLDIDYVAPAAELLPDRIDLEFFFFWEGFFVFSPFFLFFIFFALNLIPGSISILCSMYVRSD